MAFEPKPAGSEGGSWRDVWGRTFQAEGKPTELVFSRNSPQAWRREQSELGEGGGVKTLNLTLQAKGESEQRRWGKSDLRFKMLPLTSV